MKHVALPLLVILAGCGASIGEGEATGNLGGAVSAGTAPYAIVDLSTRAITWYNELPAGAADPGLRTSRVAFRRVAVGGTEALVGIFELTQAQWEAIDGTRPWESVPTAVVATSAGSNPSLPAYNLDHQTVVDALASFPLSAGGRFTVPSDAQWTAACGAASAWWWGASAGSEALTANAVVRESVISSSRLDLNGIDTGGPLAVGTRAANQLGMFDVHGNVWELVAPGDRARGGSWSDPAWSSRAEQVIGSAQGLHAGLDHALIGVRLVLVP